MALFWNLTDVENSDELFGSDEKMLPRPWSVVMATMLVGIGKITPETVPEFYARISLLERLSGTLNSAWVEEGGKWVDSPMRPEHIWRMVGLTTNVSYEKESAFLWRVTGGHMEDRKAEACKADPVPNRPKPAPKSVRENRKAMSARK